MWWVAAMAAAAELQGFQRVWVKAGEVVLQPEVPAEPVVLIAWTPNDGVDALPVVAAVEAAGYKALIKEGGVWIQGAGVESLQLSGHTLADLGTVLRMPDLAPELPGPPDALRIENPQTRRVQVEVNGTLIGRLDPRAVGAIIGVPAGTYRVAVTGPDGERREAMLETERSHPGLTAPPAATLPGVVSPSTP